MKVTEHLARADKTLFSFEILPPKKGQSIDGIFQTVEALLPFNPSFIDVTYHATQVIEKQNTDGSIIKVPVHKRPGTLSVCAAIKYKYGIDTVPHLICSGFSRDETEDALVELSFLGIDNVMALRGDPVGGDSKFTPASGGHSYAIDLIRQVSDLNQGKWLHHEIGETEPTDFCIGAAGYPEKHSESPNISTDMDHLKAKIDAGAGFIVTQMFFDNEAYFRFVDACRAAGITVPIIPGIKPLATRGQVTVLPKTFAISLPEELTRAAMATENKPDLRKVGIDWSVRQCAELIANDAPCLHFYTMSRSKAVKQIAATFFGN
jgi:methylenetetrahydrofolate reductase (NADPH)